MKVRAVFSAGKFGFYGSERRYNGDEFDIDRKHFSEVWMVKVGTKREKLTLKKAAKEGAE